MLESILIIVGFWLLFGRYSYWISLSFQTEEVKRKVLFSYFLEGVLLCAIFVEFFTGNIPYPMQKTVLVTVAGFLLICTGVISSLVAQKQLGKAWTHAASAKIKPKQQLITHGSYRMVRHPIYTGIVFSYIGSQLLVGSWLWISCLFLFVPLYIQAKKEEILLKKRFGEKFERYQKQTNMLIPYIF